MLTGNGSLSLKKKDIVNQKVPATGFKKTVFAHKASAGQTGIDLTLLTAPTELTSLGFSQPSGGELTNANLLFFRNNLKLVSSVRGQLVDFLSYTVSGSTRITFQGFTSLEGEIFIGYIDYNAVTSSTVVDASPIIATGTLAASSTDFAVGTPFKVNQFATQQVGAVTVFLDGVQQYRNSGNSSSVLDGNYYEVDNGAGLGTIIRFNVTSLSARSVAVTSNGLMFERPSGSMMAAIESIQGQVNNMGTYVAALAGLALATVLGGAPTYQDLSAFGDRVLALESSAMNILGLKTFVNGIKPSSASDAMTAFNADTVNSPFSITALGGGSITGGVVSIFRYSIVNKMMTVTCVFTGFTVSGTVSGASITIPAGKLAVGTNGPHAYCGLYDNSASNITEATVGVGGNGTSTLYISKAVAANFAVSAGNSTISFTCTFPIQ